MTICHIISMKNIEVMGSITQEIYNRCDGDHICDSVFNPEPKEADIYIMHHFRNHAEAFDEAWKKPKGSRLISLIHSCEPCFPHPEAEEIITITKAWQNILYSDFSIKSKMIRGAIDLTEYLKIKPDYDKSSLCRIARNQEGKTHHLYYPIIDEYIRNDFIGNAYFITNKIDGFTSNEKINYITDLKIGQDKEKATILSKCSFYADAHSIDKKNLFMETFCVALLEGMAAGLAPVILGQYQPAMREVLGHAGICTDDFDYFEAYLYRLGTSKDARQHYGELARERAKEFKLERMIKEWNQLIKSLL